MESEPLTVSRWFRLTLEHEEELKASLLEWAREHDVRLAWLQGLGEAAGFRVAAGYREGTPESSTLMREVSASHHAVALGTIDRRGEREEVHLHGPLGRDGETHTGCWADRPAAYRGMEFLAAVLETED